MRMYWSEEIFFFPKGIKLKLDDTCVFWMIIYSPVLMIKKKEDKQTKKTKSFP